MMLTILTTTWLTVKNVISMLVAEVLQVAVALWKDAVYVIPHGVNQLTHV